MIRIEGTNAELSGSPGELIYELARAYILLEDKADSSLKSEYEFKDIFQDIIRVIKLVDAGMNEQEAWETIIGEKADDITSKKN